MSVFKQFSSQDVIITPFKVNKSFSFTGSSALTSSNVGIDRFIGTNITGTFYPSVDPITGYINTGSYQRLVYNSIKELYYTNFISSSKGDEATQTVLYNGVLLTANNNQPRYENYLQSTLLPNRLFPTGSGDQIGVISIPTKLFGEQIKPKSFLFTNQGGSILDDGEGNIYYSSTPYVATDYVNTDYFIDASGSLVGNIFYSHGIITIMTASISGSDDLLNNFIAINSASRYDPSFFEGTMSFSSTYTIYETQYKCTIRENEFNFSLNPTLLSGSSNDVPYNYTTSSFFDPYITTIGLYNDNQDLLAVAKLVKPLPSSRTTDMNIIINIDR